VVVDLSVDTESNGARGVVEGLRAAHRVHNTQTLVAEHSLLVHINTVPVGTTVSDPLGKAQCLLAQDLRVFLATEYGEDAAHLEC
jgi:glycerol dehydrogenase-like iron-containing ADH family enzyme